MAGAARSPLTELVATSGGISAEILASEREAGAGGRAAIRGDWFALICRQPGSSRGYEYVPVQLYVQWIRANYALLHSCTLALACWWVRAVRGSRFLGALVQTPTSKVGPGRQLTAKEEVPTPGPNPWEAHNAQTKRLWMVRTTVHGIIQGHFRSCSHSRLDARRTTVQCA